MRSWPKKYADWADGDPQAIGSLKGFTILSPNGPKYLDESAELRDCLKNNWPEDLHRPIRSLLLSTLTVFKDSTRATLGGRTEVPHAQFINILDQWLVEHSEFECEYSNCPDFKDSRFVRVFLFRLTSLRLTISICPFQEYRIESSCIYGLYVNRWYMDQVLRRHSCRKAATRLHKRNKHILHHNKQDGSWDSAATIVHWAKVFPLI